MKKLVLSLAAALVVGAGAMVLTTGGQKAEAGGCVPGSIGKCTKHKTGLAWEYSCVIGSIINPVRDCQ